MNSFLAGPAVKGSAEGEATGVSIFYSATTSLAGIKLVTPSQAVKPISKMAIKALVFFIGIIIRAKSYYFEFLDLEIQ